MRKGLIFTLCATLTLSSCGAYEGATLGSMLGSAIGGISGGPRGSDIGTIVGMAGGAVVGVAVNNAAEKAQQEKYRKYQEERDARYSQRQTQTDNSGFDPTNSGDDRITLEPGGDYSTVSPTTIDPATVSVDQLGRVAPGYSFKYNSLIEVRNASFADSDGNGVITAGEVCKVSFEIMNRSDIAIYDVQPIVLETSGNKHIHVSPCLYVESIAPHRGVRYTATVAADRRLKDGQAVLKVAVAQGNKEITSQVKQFVVQTARR